MEKKIEIKKKEKNYVLKVVLWANSNVKVCEKAIIGYEKIMVLSSIMLLYFVNFKHHSYLLFNESHASLSSSIYGLVFLRFILPLP